MTFLGVGEWLARRSELTPAKVGLVDGETGARYTWQTLNVRARALATLLREDYAVAQGDRVAVLALNAPEYLDAFYACALLGAMLVPLNWRLTPTELTALLGDSAPRVLLADQHYADMAHDVATRQPDNMAVLPFAGFPGADEAMASAGRSLHHGRRRGAATAALHLRNHGRPQRRSALPPYDDLERDQHPGELGRT